MSSRKYPRHLHLIAALTFGTFGALGGLALTPAHARADDATSARPLIITRGSGEVQVQPDSVHVDVGTDAQATTLDDARTQVSTAMSHVLDAFHKLEGVPNLTLETRQIRFSPVYGPTNNNKPPAIIGYTATNHVIVTVEHAPGGQLSATSARLVDVALDAGANDVGSVELYLADPTAAEQQALTLAVQNAADDAQTMARAAGVTLTGPVSIEEDSASRAPRSFALEAAMVSTPVAVGDITISSNVTAHYAFH
jgi:uncharacterized protein YggE